MISIPHKFPGQNSVCTIKRETPREEACLLRRRLLGSDLLCGGLLGRGGLGGRLGNAAGLGLAQDSGLLNNSGGLGRDIRRVTMER